MWNGWALRIEGPGAVYPVASRRNERREMLQDGADREPFLVQIGSSTPSLGPESTARMQDVTPFADGPVR
jgi:hypothetical protein